jgi:hypothetical protein
MIYDDDIINDLVICVYTLVDGSRVIGEEVDYNYNNGYIEVYGVMEFLERDFKTRLLPYVPENLDTTFIFHERNVISRSDVTTNLKKSYLLTLTAFASLYKGDIDDIKSSLDEPKGSSPDLGPLDLGKNWRN